MGRDPNNEERNTLSVLLLILAWVGLDLPPASFLCRRWAG